MKHWAILFCAWACVFSRLWAQPQTLDEHLQAAVKAIRGGEAEAALQWFAAAETIFGDDPVWDEPDVARVYLAWSGLALLEQGKPDVAAQHLSAFFERFPAAVSKRPVLFYACAQAHDLSGDTRATGFYERYLRHFPDRAEAHLARFRLAALWFKAGDTAAARSALEQLARPPWPTSVRSRAQLQLTTLFPEGATKWLLQLAQTELSPLDAAAYGRLAETAARREMTAGQPGRACDLLSAIIPRETLVAALSTSGREALHPGARVAITTERARLDADMDRDERIARLLGRACLADNRPYAAIAVLAGESRNKPQGAEPDTEALRADLLYALLAAWDWVRFDAALESFRQDFPSSSHMPEVLAAQAESFLIREDFVTSRERFEALVSDYPEHRLAVRWQYLAGHGAEKLGDFAAARFHYQTVAERSGAKPLGFEARLRFAGTYFNESRFADADAALARIAGELASNDRWRVEVLYQRALCAFARGNLDAAAHYLRDLEAGFGDHPRNVEAYLLRASLAEAGDDRAGALEHLRRVTPEHSQVFGKARLRAARLLQQAGERTKATQELEQVLEHSRKLKDREQAYRQLADLTEADGDRLVPVLLRGLEDLGGERRSMLVGEWLERLETHAGVPRRVLSARGMEMSPPLESLLLLREDRAEALLAMPLADLNIEALDASAQLAAGERQERLRFLARHFSREPLAFSARLELAKGALEAELPEKAYRWLAPAMAAFPGHEKVPKGEWIMAKIDWARGEREAAVVRLEALAASPIASHRVKAEALLTWARWEHALERSQRAVALFQRLYSLYVWADGPAPVAYIESAEVLAELGQPKAAHETLKNFLSEPRFENHSLAPRAEQRMAELERLLAIPADPS